MPLSPSITPILDDATIALIHAGAIGGEGLVMFTVQGV
jgi:hypothetical protein